MNLIIQGLLLVTVTCALRSIDTEVERVEIRDDGRACVKVVEIDSTTVEEETQETTVPPKIAHTYEPVDRYVPAIVVFIIGIAAITNSLPLFSWGSKTVVLVVQGAKSDLGRVDDYTSLQRAVNAMLYALHFGAYAYPAVCGISKDESRAYGLMTHYLSIMTMSWNIAEAINLHSVVRGGSDNRFHLSGVWIDMVLYVLTNLGGAAIFTLVLFVAEEGTEIASWSSLGPIGSGFALANVMIVALMGMGLVAAAINLRSAVAYENEETQAAVDNKCVDEEHWEEVQQLVRTRWYAPFISLLTAGCFCLNITALDAHDDFTALVSLFASVACGAVSAFCVLHSLGLLKKIGAALSKCASKLIAFCRR